jgi:SAM-dependent methyltransferase
MENGKTAWLRTADDCAVHMQTVNAQVHHGSQLSPLTRSSRRRTTINWMARLELMPVTVVENSALVALFRKRIIERAEAGNRVPSILEAGCGRLWPIKLDIPYTLTGIDLDPEALRSRLEEVGDLDKAIVGDIRNTSIVQDGTCDVIYSAFLLEHVKGAEAALSNFSDWLRPNGVMLLRFPDPSSVYGWMAKKSPHFLHVWYYRYILRRHEAGRPGHAPYPTTYDRILDRANLHKFIKRHGLVIEEEVGTSFINNNPGYMWKVINTGIRWVSLVSNKRLTSEYNDLAYIIRKI